MKQSAATMTERITILGTPQFKAFLQKEARAEGVSVSQLIRERCEMKAAGEDEELLLALVAQVRESTEKARASLEKGLADAEACLAELRADS